MKEITTLEEIYEELEKAKRGENFVSSFENVAIPGGGGSVVDWADLTQSPPDIIEQVQCNIGGWVEETQERSLPWHEGEFFTLYTEWSTTWVELGVNYGCYTEKEAPEKGTYEYFWEHEEDCIKALKEAFIQEGQVPEMELWILNLGDGWWLIGGWN